MVDRIYKNRSHVRRNYEKDTEVEMRKIRPDRSIGYNGKKNWQDKMK